MPPAGTTMLLLGRKEGEEERNGQGNGVDENGNGEEGGSVSAAAAST